MNPDDMSQEEFDKRFEEAAPLLKAMRVKPTPLPPEKRAQLIRALDAISPLHREISRDQMRKMLLALLCKQSTHGITLADQLAAANFSLKGAGEGAIYGILNELEEAGLIAAEWSERGPRMAKLYRATDQGRRRTEEQTQSSPELETWVRAVLRTT